MAEQPSTKQRQVHDSTTQRTTRQLQAPGVAAGAAAAGNAEGARLQDAAPIQRVQRATQPGKAVEGQRFRPEAAAAGTPHGTDLTYWSVNKWGMPGRPSTQTKPGSGGEQRRSSAHKHYQPPGSPIKDPGPDVFASLGDLEAQMRGTLGALASFNEDERMIFIKACRREEEQARQRNEPQPPGLLNVSQFKHVWRKFRTHISTAQAHALYLKYGCDAQGLLPYEVFAPKLLSSPARLLALEPEQKGPYKAGKDASFHGKIVYRYCRKPVHPPSNWDGSAAARSAKVPKAGLQLEWVFGYNGLDVTTCNAFYTSNDRIVYCVAAVGVVYDPCSHTQAFFTEHDDDIRCLAMHPSRSLVATGQVASALDGTADCPFVCIWDPTTTPPKQVARLDFPSEGGASSRFIVAVGFSPCGERLAVVTGDNRHTTYVYDWRRGIVLCQGVGHNGQPPQVYGVVFNPFCRAYDESGDEVPSPDMFVTYGTRHIKFWVRSQENGREVYNTSHGKFGRAPITDVCSVRFLPTDWLVSGAPSGELLLWDISQRRGAYGCCCRIIQAHGPGLKAPSIFDGQPALQGVRALTMRNNNTELISAGSDGQLMVWDATDAAGVGRLMQAIQFQDPAEASSPASFRALDARPGGGELLVGTSRCDLWEINQGIPEPLIQGHSGDVYGIAWHPRKPYKFATACDSSSVYLWHAKRRQLIAKIAVGEGAHSVAFSPDGAHLAVGCVSGSIKVLSMEPLGALVAEMHHAKEAIDEIKYSPDGSKLAAGSHDNFIDVYDTTKGYQRIARCCGHSSYLRHIDWSASGRVLQSSCGAYELLYFEASTGKQVQQNQRDTAWATYTNILGFSVMGVWQDGSDGTDINAVDRTHRVQDWLQSDPLVGEGQYVATSGDDGRVRLFAYPCVVEDAPGRAYKGHSSHVMAVRFAPHNKWLASAGGKDRAIFLWRLHPDMRAEEAAAAAAAAATTAAPEAFVYQQVTRKRLAADLASDIAKKPVAGEAQGGAGTAAAVAAAEAARQAELAAAKAALQVTYEVTVVTSDIRGAGTDAAVFVLLYGSAGHSGEIRLENHKDNFSRGRVDTFTLTLPQDLGAIDRLRIGHNAKGACPRWHCAHVTVTNKSMPGAAPTMFPCNMWFARDEGDGECTRLLHAAPLNTTTTNGPRRYKVTVRTSDMRGAGTDANVTITLFGTATPGISSGPYKLENSANNFERGASDVFEVEAKEALGPLSALRIGHDNTGLGPSWHLQDVTVSSPGMPEVQFVANRWLAVDQGDGQCTVTLLPVGAKGAAAATIKKYRVHVYTSDIRGAGTDANISLTMFGAAGSIAGPFKLETSKNNFERGAEDIFFVEHPDVGDIKEIEIGHDNSGPSPGWHLQQVVVVDEATVKRWTFGCDRWLAKDEEDGLIRRRLGAMAPGAESTSYRVVVYTSDIRGAGTDAGVWIELIGQKDGKPTQGPRLNLDNSKNDFERGAVDTFLLTKQRPLGPLTAVRIGHDNKGAGPGWHLSHVEVTDDSSGVTAYFPCNNWLDKKEGDGAIERLLPAAVKGSTDAAGARCMYKVTVYTSDIRFAGTDANVFVELLGDKDGKPTSSGRHNLNSSKNDFERGAVDAFPLMLPDLGQLQRILIGHDNRGAGASWHLQGVEVLSLSSGQQLKFTHNGWLSRDEPPYKTEVELWPEGSTDATSGKCRYQVVTYTSDIRGAGTDANVSCVLRGTKGATALLLLESSANNFERGQRDEFIVESADVGPFTQLQIGHDNKGLAAAWHLQHVEVTNQTTGERASFYADTWLDAKAGTSTLLLEPATGPGAAAGSKNRYKISVQTADKRGAGTDADVSVVLMGEGGKASQELRLESGANNFERNKLDEFIVDVGTLELGQLQKLEIGFATKQNAAGAIGGLLGLSWGLQSVEATHMASGTRQVFMFDDWLSSKRRRVQLVPGAVGGINNSYKVTVRTSDIRGAGTDANVSITLFGSKDGVTVDSGPQKLENSANNFERAACDTFMLKCKDLGDLKRVVITSDGSGLGASWHLDSVEVLDAARGTSITFPCGRWLDGSADPGSLQQTLLPAGAGAAGAGLLTYEVVVYTSDIRGAGTDANVTLELQGDKDRTSAMKLESSANDFERGQRNVFKLQAPELGELVAAIVRKDDSGVGSDWHLQAVEVLHPGLGKRFNFPCNDWLKGKAERKLTAGQAAAASSSTTYRISVTTSDVRGAGTDADVSVVVYGDQGDTGERRLESSANDFERGQTNTFFLQAPNIGAIQSLRIGHNNKGLAAAWHLAAVEVVNMSSGETAMFPYHNWVDKEHGLSQLLWPDRDGDGKGDVGTTAALVEYQVKVYTSDIRGAGTDANVFLELRGTKGGVGECRLDNASNNFERGRIDLFVVKASDVGELTSIVIRHDNAGGCADWHLQQVEVVHPGLGKTFAFPCNDWLKAGPNGDLAGCRRELAAGTADSTGPTSYKVVVTTSDIRGAGTDADVFLTIYGTKGDTGERKLDNSTNNFERAAVDTFFVPCGNIGELQRIKLRSSGSGLGAAWHLATVEVQSAATGEALVFPHHNWLDKEHGLEVDLWPDRDGDGKGDAGVCGELIAYKVAVYTSDVRGAGTDANVTIEMHGTKGLIGQTRLDNAANNFERGRRDEFVIMGSDVGELTHVVVAHDNSGIGSEWHLQQVEVLHPGLNRTFTFSCNDWIKPDPASSQQGCSRTLHAAGTAGADAAGPGIANYRVVVTTSDIRGAGTDADVFLTIYGTKGDTGERKLDNSTNNFERAAVDTFFVQAPDVGEVQRIRVRSSNRGIGAAWHLAKVEVVVPSTGALLAFPLNDWIDSKHGLDKELWPDVDGDGVGDVSTAAGALIDYAITTYTSDIRGAGTDASVFVELHGSKGSIGQTRLDNAANNYERGRADTFTIKASDIGDINQLVIWHDDAGMGSDWHLHQVEVRVPAVGGKTVCFPCGKWLHKDKERGAAGCRAELVPAGEAVTDGSSPTAVSYKVVTSTGSDFGAGTDANVIATIFGSKGDTGPHELDNSSNNFERGATDTFFIQGPDVGSISSLKLEMSGGGLTAAWQLASATVTHPGTGQVAAFMYGDWFNGKKGWVQVLQADISGSPDDATSASAAPKLVEYEVTAYTSDIHGAGTAGDVFVALTGANGSIGERCMQGGRGSFERNKKYVFRFQASDIGALQSATIRLHEHGLGAAWHLKQVEVLSKATGITAVFPHNGWVQKGKGQKEDAVVVLREASLGRAAPDPNAPVKFKVTVVTSDLFGAGTDAPVFITVTGPKGQLGLGELALANSSDAFERGQVDEFFLELPTEQDCGAPITKLMVERGGSLLPGSDWHLDHICIHDTARGHTYKWHCCAWFDTKHGTKKTWDASVAGPQALQLTEGPPEAMAGAVGANAAEAAGMGPYRLQFVTSDRFGAGTSARVRLQLEGGGSSSSKGGSLQGAASGAAGPAAAAAAAGPVGNGACWQPLLERTREHFQRAGHDDFVATCPVALGALSSARVWQEGGGLGAAWHLDHVLVTHLASGRVWRFGCKGWVPKGTGPAEGLQLQAEEVMPAATAAAGTKGGQLVQGKPGAAGETDDSGVEAAEALEAAVARSGARLPAKQPGQQAGLPASASDGLPPLLDAGDWAGADGNQAGAARMPSEYEVIVCTGDRLGAGTDAAVTLEVLGQSGTASRHTLPQGRALFERRSVDSFRLLLSEGIGAVASLRAWTDGAGLGSDWFLSHVDVEQLATGMKWRCEFNQWVKGSEAHAVKAPAKLISPGRAGQESTSKAQQSLQRRSVQPSTQQQQQQQQSQPSTTSLQQQPVPAHDTGGRDQKQDSRSAGSLAAAAAASKQQRPSAAMPPDPPEPTCDWQQHQAPYPGDESYMVTYYYNSRTGASQYDKPAEFAQWESAHAEWQATCSQKQALASGDTSWSIGAVRDAGSSSAAQKSRAA